jgi:serine/threonine protein kinase
MSKCIAVTASNERCKFPRVKTNNLNIFCRTHYNQYSRNKKSGGHIYNQRYTDVVTEIESIMPSSFLETYKIESLLGFGSFGYVFKIKNTENNKLYAMKINYELLTSNKQNRKVQIEYMNRIINIMQTEYNLMLTKFKDIDGMIKAIPNELKVLNNSRCIMCYYITKIYGNTLNRAFDDLDQKLSQKQIKHIGYQLATTINQIHSKGYLYIDLHLDNILLRKDSIDDIVIIDLGLIVKIEKAEMEYSGHPFGMQIFVSVNGNFAEVPNKLGDYQSICYILMYLTLGYLPWYKLFNNPTAIGTSKVALTKSKDFGKLPTWLRNFIFHIYNDYPTEFENPDIKTILKLLS